MSEAKHPQEDHLRNAVTTFLSERHIQETIGPSRAYFEMPGEDGDYIFYHSYAFGVSTERPAPPGRTNHSGRYGEYQDIEDAVLEHLGTITPGHQFLIWRSGPDLIVEKGFIKAYLRYATTYDPVVFDQAARQYIDQVAQYGR